MLDIDHSSAHTNKEFDIESVSKDLNELHFGLEQAFVEAVTPEALNEWKQSN